MNDEEKIVHKLLKKDYPEQIIFEPDGNIPPDFKIGDNRAVEVRRLNQNFFQEDQVEGLEKLSIPIFDAFHEVLISFGKQKSDFSYFVGMLFERPIDLDIYALKKLIKEKLKSFLYNPDQTFPFSFAITDEVELIIQKTQSNNKHLFRPMGGMDNDAGGFIISMYIENIRYCIYEKSEKTKSHLHRYNEWWLYLVDRMVWDLDIYDIKEITKNIQDIGNFDKVSIIRNGEISFIID
jgi:hypothetical protein